MNLIKRDCRAARQSNYAKRGILRFMVLLFIALCNYWSFFYQQKIDLLEAQMPLHSTIQCKHNFHSTGKPKNSWLALLLCSFSVISALLNSLLEPNLQYLRRVLVFPYLNLEVYDLRPPNVMIQRPFKPSCGIMCSNFLILKASFNLPYRGKLCTELRQS